MTTYFSCSSCDRADLCEKCFIDLSPCHSPGSCTALVCWVCQPNPTEPKDAS